MIFESGAREPQRYRNAVRETVAAGEYLLGPLSAQPESRAGALAALCDAAESINSAGLAFEGRENEFFQASAELRSAALLLAMRRAADGGDGSILKQSLGTFTLESRDIDAGVFKSAFFDDDLLAFPSTSASPEDALAVFKTRATRTVDNMLSETFDVLQDAIEKFEKDFARFAVDLASLGGNLSFDSGSPLTKEIGERATAGLKKLGEFLRSDDRKEAVNLIQDAIKSGLKGALSVTLACAKTKDSITNKALRPGMTEEQLTEAGKRMATFSRDFVELLRYAKWTIRAAGAVGGLLILTGVFAHYAPLAAPIAYAIAAAATVLIAIDYARVKIGALVAEI